MGTCFSGGANPDAIACEIFSQAHYTSSDGLFQAIHKALAFFPSCSATPKKRLFWLHLGG
jgi:hypothetical protein